MRRLTPLCATAVLVCAGGLLNQASAAGGSLSITPSIVEHQATPGPVAQVTVANTTGAPLKITVTPRPWLQGRSGRVVPNRRHTLLSQVRVSRRTFTLAAGARRAITLTLLHRPSGGSLYGSVEVIGLPTTKAKTNGIVAEYQLIGSLRLDPAPGRARIRVVVGPARVSGRGRHAVVVLAVRNRGNTVGAIAGTVRLTSARGTMRRPIAAVRVVPGAVVDLRLGAARGLARGHYTAAIALTQDGKKAATTTRTLTVR